MIQSYFQKCFCSSLLSETATACHDKVLDLDLTKIFLGLFPRSIFLTSIKGMFTEWAAREGEWSQNKSTHIYPVTRNPKTWGVRVSVIPIGYPPVSDHCCVIIILALPQVFKAWSRNWEPQTSWIPSAYSFLRAETENLKLSFTVEWIKLDKVHCWPT